MIFRPRNRRALMGSVIEGGTVTGDFRDGLAWNSTFTDVLFREAKLDRINIHGSAYTRCVFQNCTLNQANLNASRFRNVEFYDCEMDQATFDASIFNDVRFTGGRAEYASFRDASLHDVVFDTQLHGADLRIAASENLDYGDSNLWGASLNISCKQFVKAKFSKRQVQMFLGLLTRTRGNDELMRKVEALLSKDYLAVLDRVIMSNEEV